MKVRISFAVEVDPDAWAEEYDIDKGQVRDDVREYVKNMALQHLAQSLLKPV